MLNLTSPKWGAVSPGRLSAEPKILALIDGTPRIRLPQLFYCSKNRWASSAAMQPVPALVMAWR